MSDPGSSMSLTAVLVLAVVVIVLLVGWLAIVFRAAREPARRPAGSGGSGGEVAGHDTAPAEAPAVPAENSAAGRD